VAVTARLPLAHLADHPAAAEKLAEQLRPGVALGPLLVLQMAAEKAKGEAGKKKKGSKKKADMLVSPGGRQPQRPLIEDGLPGAWQPSKGARPLRGAGCARGQRAPGGTRR
jgi:hypothetical protein